MVDLNFKMPVQISKNYEAFKTKNMVIKNLMIEKFKIKNFTNSIKEIKENFLYVLVTQKVINPYVFILWAIEKYKYIDELYIATYRLSYKAAINLKYLVESRTVKKLIIVANDNYETLMKDKADILLKLDKENDNFKLIKKNSHAKVTLIKAKNEYIVISGSGNYSTNPKIEQYTILKNKELYNFHKEWMLNEMD